MKATELMIGDWVKIFDFIHPRQVDIIDMYSIRVSEYHYPNCNTIAAAHNCPESEITPIPLTPEILEKNGFNRHGCVSKNEQYQVLIQHWSEDNLALNKVGKHGNPVFIPDLIYVHELQHALRLCGLDDLANNFQI